jgi:hypothetical protein
VTLGPTDPAGWIIPGLIALCWLVLVAVRRTVPPRWFFPAAAGLAILCFPAGVVAAKLELSGLDCTPDNLCFSADEARWWYSGILGLAVVVALILITGIGVVLSRIRRPPNA